MKYLYVGALGPGVDARALDAVRETAAAQFQIPVKEIELPPVDFAYDPGRRQYQSIAVLEILSGMVPLDAAKVVGVTERDLFVPVLTFVFGQAQLSGQVAVVSLARLRQEFYALPENREVFLERAVKEALHEIGHMFGLVHCADGSCVMSLATNVRHIDRKQAGLCASCEGALNRRRTE
jgi:archaemetzincin